jgi:hypothetical protein
MIDASLLILAPSHGTPKFLTFDLDKATFIKFGQTSKIPSVVDDEDDDKNNNKQC